MEILLGVFCAMFAVAMVAVGMAAGFAIGWVTSGRRQRTEDKAGPNAAPAEIPEEERRRLEKMQAEQDAFRQMMGYTTDIAYGMTGTEIGGEGR